MRIYFVVLALLCLSGCRDKSKVREKPLEDRFSAEQASLVSVPDALISPVIIPPVTQDTTADAKALLRERATIQTDAPELVATVGATQGSRPIAGAEISLEGEVPSSATAKIDASSDLSDASPAGADRVPEGLISSSDAIGPEPSPPDSLLSVAAKAPNSQGAAFQTVDTKESVATILKPSELIQIILKNPSNREFKITWDDVINSEVVKTRKGSDQFYFYLVHMFNDINKGLAASHPVITTEFAHLCYDSDCAKGLDIKKITPEDVHLMLKYSSSLNTVRVSAQSRTEDDQSSQNLGAILFLQGNLSPPGWGPIRYELFLQNGLKGEDLPHRQKLRHEVMDYIDKHNIREIGVNLPHQFGPGSAGHYDVNVFIELGRFIKKRNLNLRIVGRCGTHCANYLVPAAETVYIEPYGHIYTEGSIYGLLHGLNRAFPKHREYLIQKFKHEWLPRFTETPDLEDPLLSTGTAESVGVGEAQISLVDFISVHIVKFAGLSEDSKTSSVNARAQRKRKVANFQDIFSGWMELVWTEERQKEFFTKIQQHQNEINRPFRMWIKTDVDKFLQSLDNEKDRSFLEDTALFIKVHTDSEIKKSQHYLRDLEWLHGRTYAYQVEMGSYLSSENDYTYKRLLDVAAHLVRDLRYQEVISVLKPHYPVPEEDKYDGVMFSTELLKGLGLDVRGENNRAPFVDWGDNVLYLTEKKIENCEFHKPDISYTKETLDECLSLP